ncbi:MAG TPA: carbon starvation CstA family protein [Candidatus Krumholzibacteria bacterium]|nr:carbon starvation CstA family protein [Candidatus Krumholzibacteria bacterium]
MSLALLAIAFMVLLTTAYRLYGGWVARQFAIDDTRETPAHRFKDGVDFEPIRPFYLFAQHFSAIAAAGPIAGPILACQSFGWLPCLLWISLGVVLIGAVHDFSTLTASVRHGATSIAEIARQHLGTRAGRALMLFIWIALIYVVVAFTDITAATFVGATEELRQGTFSFNPGGAVAAASVMYLVLAVIMGCIQRFLPRIPLWFLSIIFVPATFGAAWFGTHISHLLVLDHRTWALLILAYCCVASVAPVWSLLQPRGYLGGFVLYAALIVGVIGVLFGHYQVQQPAFKGFNVGGMTGAMFPFLFVTIACGACSGFHGLVCSGTTCKQVDRESHMQPIGYGAMLGEGFVALIALVTIMIAAPGSTKGLSPGTIYGNGIGQFLTLVIGKNRLAFATTFGAMAFSTFVFDTLDVCMRLGRYLLQELFNWRTRTGGMVLTLASVVIPVYILAFGESGAWLKFWTLFGASNQLLAALSLLVITVWLHQARKRIAFTLLPMLFVLVITLWSLIRLAIANAMLAKGIDVAGMNAVSAAALTALALYLVISAIRKTRGERSPSSEARAA